VFICRTSSTGVKRLKSNLKEETSISYTSSGGSSTSVDDPVAKDVRMGTAMPELSAEDDAPDVHDAPPNPKDASSGLKVSSILPTWKDSWVLAG
jgi:hypothetical protein